MVNIHPAAAAQRAPPPPAAVHVSKWNACQHAVSRLKNLSDENAEQEVASCSACLLPKKRRAVKGVVLGEMRAGGGGAPG